MNIKHPNTQLRLLRGISLPIVLIFVVIISLLATVGIRRATISEKLSNNQMDFEVARQAAEAALRDGERDLFIPSGTLQTDALCARLDEREGGLALTPPYFGDTCPRGQCYFDKTYYDASNFDTSTKASPVSPQPWWPDAKGGLWGDVVADKPSDAAGAGVNCTTFTGGVPIGTFTGTPRMPGVARQPEYLIELFRIGDDTLFRITARGFGSNVQAEVVLQSYVSF